MTNSPDNIEQQFADEVTSIFTPPDIRKQTLADAEDFLQQKRAKRMVQAYTAKQKETDKLLHVGKSTQAKYEKKLELLEKRLAAVTTAIEKADQTLRELNELNHDANNITRNLLDD